MYELAKANGAVGGKLLGAGGGGYFMFFVRPFQRYSLIAALEEKGAKAAPASPSKKAACAPGNRGSKIDAFRSVELVRCRAEAMVRPQSTLPSGGSRADLSRRLRALRIVRSNQLQDNLRVLAQPMSSSGALAAVSYTPQRRGSIPPITVRSRRCIGVSAVGIIQIRHLIHLHYES